MRRDDSTRMRHMLDASRLAIGFSTGLARANLDGDPRTAFAMVKGEVDLDVLWSTIVADLPPLIDALEAALAQEQP